MRQVPCYLIVGNGRVARHVKHYFSELALSFESWDRKEPIEHLRNHLNQATHVLVLISDNAIESFFESHLQATSAVCIHFSGSLVSKNVYGAHPLMSFNEAIYTLKDYQAIPFIVDHDAPPFENLLPGLSNQNIRLHTAFKAKYHALCVLSGNFSCLLWQKLFDHLEEEFNIPSSIAHAYLLRQTHNLIDDSKKALTGPLVRGDEVTLHHHLNALQGDPIQAIYQSFVTYYRKMTEGKTQ